MARDAAPPATRRGDYLPPAFLVDHVDLTLELDPHATRVRTRLSFRRNPVASGVGGLSLAGEQQKSVRFRLDGRPLDPTAFTTDGAWVTFNTVPDRGELAIDSEIDPAANTALEGLYLSSGVVCTQCEAEGFRRITFFPDRPDVLARYRVTLIADRLRFPVLLSNGNLVREQLLGDGRHLAVWDDPFPKPSYLFALVAGQLAALEDEFVTRSGRRVGLSIHSTPQNLPRCTHAMESLKRAMRWDEERFGLEYDLDRFMIFSADDFNFGAMENKGLNIFNSKLVLASHETATDDDYQRIEAVVAHEYFHNWSGNRVTCRDWFQLSLKEGLTVFRDQEFSADMGSRALVRIDAVEFLRTTQFAEDAGPMAHPVRPDEYAEINNFYTSTVYEKGAELIRMQHTLLGEQRFRQGIDLYFSRHDGHAVTCDDFVQAMQDASGIDLSAFRQWYSQAGTPTLEVIEAWDPASAEFVLEFSQHTAPTPGQSEKRPVPIPISVGLLGPDGADIEVTLEGSDGIGRANHLLVLGGDRGRFRFTGVSVRPVASILRGLSAPVRLVRTISAPDLLHLATHDTDPVNRWDAAQNILAGAIRRAAETWQNGVSPNLDPLVVQLVGALLADTTGDAGLRARALGIPPIDSLLDSIAPVRLDALLAARDQFRRTLAVALRKELESCHAQLADRGPCRHDPASVGRRMLRGSCLRLLAAIDDVPSRERAVRHFDEARNLTEMLAALAALNDSEAPERDLLVARFEQHFADNALVLDKSAALTARSARRDALSRIEARLRHPGFDHRNPNRIRALVQTFANENWHRFHEPAGSGYRFVADQVICLDRTNPQVAARIAAAFNRYRQLDPGRIELQRRELERIGAAPGLSSDVGEIVAKALA